ncbi:MAG: hypothetical protein MRERV_64c005 [Mycoplasmataceae bacterium RV_VA103A]|nr:MAG: hypothetical protein MRERV_64c005 [Mycoplasmataceae bacterium RV_VA103A]
MLSVKKWQKLFNMEKSTLHNSEITNKLNLEMLKLIQEQETKINFLAQRLRDTNNYLLRAEIETHILTTCLNIVGDKYNLSRREKRKIILQAIEEMFPDIFL